MPYNLNMALQKGAVPIFSRKKKKKKNLYYPWFREDLNVNKKILTTKSFREPPAGVVQPVGDCQGFHHILSSSSHEDCNCNFWKSQKPIKPGVCVGSEFPSSSSSWWYPWAYPIVPWGVGQ